MFPTFFLNQHLFLIQHTFQNSKKMLSTFSFKFAKKVIGSTFLLSLKSTGLLVPEFVMQISQHSIYAKGKKKPKDSIFLCHYELQMFMMLEIKKKSKMIIAFSHLSSPSFSRTTTSRWLGNTSLSWNTATKKCNIDPKKHQQQANKLQHKSATKRSTNKLQHKDQH